MSDPCVYVVFWAPIRGRPAVRRGPAWEGAADGRVNLIGEALEGWTSDHR